MTRTVWGLLTDELGTAQTEVLVQGIDGPQLRHKVWATPALEVRSTQPAFIGIDQHHDHRWVGKVVSLQRRGTNLWCIGEIDDHVAASVAVKVGSELRHVEHDLYWSAERRGTEDFKDITIDAVSLTPWPARVSPRAVTIRDGDVHMARYKASDPFEKTLLEQAERDQREQRSSGVTVVSEVGRPKPQTPAFEPLFSPRTIETRSAQVADVSYPDRTVEIVAAPYGIEATVPYRGRMVTEVFSNTAFIDVDRQPNRSRIRVWLDHQPEKVVGRITYLDPLDPSGLVAQFKVADTRRGNETLELLGLDALDASVGFKVLAEKWEGTSRRRVTKAWLHHLGLTSDPAYDGTHVLAVRGADLA